MKDRPFSVSRQAMAVLLAAMAVNVASVRGETFLWLAATTGDWSVGANWTNGSPPSAGADVVITNVGSSVILSGSTPALNSLTISRTLTFTNWNTTLNATNITILNGGVVTHFPCTTNNGPTNNLYIVCTNLMIETGGSINADYKGFRSGLINKAGHGPGAGHGGPIGGYENWGPGGAGHGGRGGLGNFLGTASATGPGHNFGGTAGGATYGSLTAPILPGSGGGALSWGGWNETNTWGGGAVRIEASGTVTVNGTITADGSSDLGWDVAGCSGGSIYIVCRAFAGTNGAVRARGGNCRTTIYGGGGGGGRIAVHYNQAAQDSIPMPSVTFSTAPGAGWRPPLCSSTGPSYGGVGTLYFTDGRFLSGAMPHSGEWNSSGVSSFTTNDLTVTGWLKFPEGFQLTVTNNITVIGNLACLELGSVTCGGNMTIRNSGALYLYRGRGHNYDGWTNSGGQQYAPDMGLSGSTSAPGFTVGGDLLVSNDAYVALYSAPTNGSDEWGLLVNVSGDIIVTNNSWIYPYCDNTNGGCVKIACKNLTVSTANAGINADARGFLWGTNGAAGRGPGGSPGSGGAWGNVGGAGYGGVGGNGTSGGPGGGTYGSSNAPVLPGSGGGGNAWPALPGFVNGTMGGGLIWIDARNTVTLNGTLKANGEPESYNDAGPGSGGAIYIVCRSFTGDTNGQLQAKGGNARAIIYAGGGGGGRIAVRYRSQTNFLGQTYVTGGTGANAGQSGTVVFVKIPQTGTLFAVH